jgi:uncharacterized protein (DUF433 family)
MVIVMPPLPATDASPIAASEDGVLRVVGSRIPIDTIVEAFHDGATPEEIGQQYPTLGLADIYHLIAHYLKHQAEFDDYLQRRREDGVCVRHDNESRWNPAGIRERLLARKLR